MRFWAIGMRGWVELREAKSPPRLIKSSMTIKAERLRLYRDDEGPWSRMAYVPVPYRRKVNQVVYLGGKVLATIKARTFINIIGASVPRDRMLELTHEDAKKLLDTEQKV